MAMDALCDWDALLLAHNGGALKEYITSTYESCETKNAAVAFCNGILESCPTISASQYPVALRLSTLRWMFASMPKLLFSHLRVPSQTVQWLSGCANSDSAPSLRGVALLVMALMLKSNVSSVGTIAPASVARNLSDVQRLMSDNSSASPAVRTQDILLHQCAEVLTLCDPKSSHCASLLSSGGLRMSCSVLQASSSDCTPMQARLDACKVYICVSEIAKHNSSTVDISSEEVLSVCAAVVDIIRSSSLLHDCLHIAYESSLPLLKSTQAWSKDTLGHIVEVVVGALESVRSKDGLSVLDVRRTEAFIGLLSAIFDECAASPDIDCTAFATMSINEINPTMEVLKKSLRGAGPAGKDMRVAASDVRKGLIAMAHSVYSACPAIITNHPEQFWEVSLRLLNTPLLFSCAFVASPENSDVVRRIVDNVSQGLSQVHKYSFPAACDVITSVEELCRSGCTAILECADKIVIAVDQLPKFSDNKTHKKEKYEWRRQVLELLRAVLMLTQTTTTVLSNNFVDQVVSMCSRDILLLRTCLGCRGSASADAASIAAAEKQRRAAAVEAQERFGSSKPEKMVSLLHLVTSTLCDLLDCGNTPIGDDAAETLQGLLGRTARDANRSLVFEDDAVQLGIDIDLVAKILSRVSGVSTAELRGAAMGLLQALSLCSSEAFLLGDTYKKMLCESLCSTTIAIVKMTADTKSVEKLEKCAACVDGETYKNIAKHAQAALSALDIM